MALTSRHRSGSVLLIVTGISVILATVGLAFVTRMRADASASLVVVRSAQARIMLMAGLLYVQEAGRIGWDQDPAAPARVRPDGSLDLRSWQRNPDETKSEGYGWVDVRDGFMGPKARAYTQVDIDAMNSAGNFPALDREITRLGLSRPLTLTQKQRWLPSPNFAIGTVMRSPMNVITRPPFAIAPVVTPNAIRTPVSYPAADPADAEFGKPFLRNPDPQPAPMPVDASVTVTTAAQAYAQFKADDPRPLAFALAGQGWFRVYRDGPATFVVTAGSGSSYGYRDWNEVDAFGRNLFNNDQALFEQTVVEEVRLWYRMEWSPGTSRVSSDTQYRGGMNEMAQSYSGTERADHPGTSPSRTNVCGTIPWIQRLATPPLVW